jgi:uracil-DNA glycosylase family 4
MEWLGRLYKSIELLDKAIIKCHKCPRLVEWREEVAVTKRKSYENEKYWGKPVPGFGSHKPKMLIVGLAPGAHGANRTGRIFTGDSSGDWLYGSLHRIGIAKIATSTSRDDGQELRDTRISMAVRCAPPENKPTTEERDACAPYFENELELIAPTVRSFVALGNFGWQVLIKSLKANGHKVPATKFGHGVTIKYSHNGTNYLIIGSYHPSQQNTFTGKLTKPMLDSVLKKAAKFAGIL